MLKALRMLAGLALTCSFLAAADWATRDCRTGPYSFENCLWLSVRNRLGWPPSKLGRAAVLELVGVGLLVGLYLTFRYVFPPLRRRPPLPQEPGQARPQRPG